MSHFLIERALWEDEGTLGKVMKEYIAKLREYGVAPIKGFEGYAFVIKPIDENGAEIN